MNKKGQENILSAWWFFCLAFVAAGIVIGVLIFYSAEMDIRELEADVLANKIADCLANEGYLADLENFNVYDCGLEEEIFENGNFYFNISFVDSQTGKKIQDKEDIIGGRISMDKECKIKMDEEIKAKHFPGCVEKQVFVLEETIDDNNNVQINKLKIKILAASNNFGESIALEK